MSKLLLLGVGNPDRGDDGLGPLFAKRMMNDPTLKKLDVYVTPHFGEGASLMDMWEPTDLTVVVDAMKSGGDVGALRRIDAVAEKLSNGVFHYSSHLFGLAEAVEMARALDRLPRSLIIYGIEGADFSFGDLLSPEVERSLQTIEDMVRQDFVGFAHA